MYILEVIGDSLSDKVKLGFIIIIFILALIDLIKKKDLKSQIVSIGILGTFVGIFIGLQDFNPDDIKNSLIGLKTTFLTSIVGIFTAIGLAIFQKISNINIENKNNEERMLLEISEKLSKRYC